MSHKILSSLVHPICLLVFVFDVLYRKLATCAQVLESTEIIGLEMTTTYIDVKK